MVKKLFILFVVIFSVGEKSYAQTWQWAKSGNGTGAEEGIAVATDTAGNVFITGGFDNPMSGTVAFGNDTLTNGGTFIVKYDANGNVLWAKGAGETGVGMNGDIGNSVSTDVAGNVFITGSFGSHTITFSTYTFTNAGSSTSANVFIAKYDANGNVLWAKSAGGTVNDEGMAVSTDASGNVFVTGYFESPNITFGTYTLTNGGTGYNIFIAKYDANGNVLWAKSVGGTGSDAGYSVSTDASGNVFITGSFSSPTVTFGSYTLTNAGSNANVFIAKYDASGNVLWAKNSAGGTGIYGDMGFSVSTDSVGDVFVTGQFASPTITFGTYTLTNAGTNANVFIAKYDANGNVLWAKRAGGASNDIGYSVSTDATGNVYLTGGFNSSTIAFGFDTLTRPVNSPDPMFIVKYDANGNVLCASALASGGDDQCGVSADRFGNAYICGDFMANPFVVGSTTLTLTGTENVFVAKWTPDCNKSGIEQYANSNEQVTIYPNPANSIINVELKIINENTSIQITDMLGNTVKQSIISNSSSIINIADLSEGVYTISITSSEGVVNKRLVIVR